MLTFPWKIAVLKFCEQNTSQQNTLLEIIHEISIYLRNGYRVLAVMSTLEEKSEPFHFSALQSLEEGYTPPPQEFAELLATEEIATACRLTIALDRAGIKTQKLHYSCLHTKGPQLNSEPNALSTDLIRTLFETYSVLIMPGAIGSNEAKKVTLLGRRGGDYTAVYVAWCLNASECVIYKERNGVYEAASRGLEQLARRYDIIHYSDVLKRSEPVIHYNALKFAQEKNSCIKIKKVLEHTSTQISNEMTRFAVSNQGKTAVKIIILISSHTHAIAYDFLVTNKEHFSCTLVTVDEWINTLLSPGVVIIDLTFGERNSLIILEDALSKKCHVITTDRSIAVEKGRLFTQLAQRNKVHFGYSATVAGAIPILEHLEHIRCQSVNVIAIRAILDPHCNLIFDKASAGEKLHLLLASAKWANPLSHTATLDRFAWDATLQAILLCRAAFGRDPDATEVKGLSQLDDQYFQTVKNENKFVRLVTDCRREGNRILVTIEPLALDFSHEFSKAHGTENMVLVDTEEAQYKWRGSESSEWSTSVSIYSDLYAIQHRHTVMKKVTKEEAVMN